MDTDSSRYLEDYYDSQNIFSYLNSEEYFKDLKKLLKTPTPDKAKIITEKIQESLTFDFNKVKKDLKNIDTKNAIKIYVKYYKIKSFLKKFKKD